MSERLAWSDSLESLLSEAWVRCECVMHNEQTAQWGTVLERTLFDKVYVITAGSGTLRLDGLEYDLKPGRAFLFPAGLIQRGHVDARAGLKVLWTHFDAFTINATRLLRVVPFAQAMEGPTAGAIEALMLRVLEASEQARPGWPLQVNSLLLEILIVALRAPVDDRLAPERVVPESEPGGGLSPMHAEKLARALALMTRDCSRPLNLPELARAVHLSPAYFSDLFGRMVGMPPMRFYLHHRMRQARKLLAVAGKPIHQVAREVGYEDPYHFSRAFRKVTGVSPTAYRKDLMLE